MKQLIFNVTLLILSTQIVFSQTDTSSIEAIYNRPFITNFGTSSTAIGGYAEANTNYFVQEGVPEGFSMEMRRFNIFLYSTISPRIKFLSELEFEHGTEEIALETALIDFELDPILTFRGGVILAPIGNFNLNHDSPKWEFIDRPLVATEIIPSTLSEIGFGLHGKYYHNNNSLSYQIYIVNGLQDGIILNSDGKTLLQNGKTPEMLGEDNNGTPMYTGKVSLQNRKIGEVGLSYYGGIYNTYKLDGAIISEQRNLSILAGDIRTTIRNKLVLQAEVAKNVIDVPLNITEIYGSEQWGYYAELIYPILKRKILKYENTVVNLCLRSEKIDYNQGTFTSTNSRIYDEISSLTIGSSLRPSSSTVLKFNYKYNWIKDFVGNPSFSAGFQFGLATYF